MKNVKIALIEGTTYRATNIGEIVNKFGRPLKGGDSGTGLFITIVIGKNKLKRTTIARLVWEAFNGPIPKGQYVCHKDGNYKNNYLSNLTLTSNTRSKKSSSFIKAPNRAVLHPVYAIKYEKLEIINENSSSRNYTRK